MSRIFWWLNILATLVMLLSLPLAMGRARADSSGGKMYLPFVTLNYAPPAPANRITAGQWHTCVLTTASGVKCWGWNFEGQLGNGGNANSHTPVDVQGLTSRVSAIAAGYEHTCALTTAGGVKCWGYNHYGELGDGTTSEKSLVPEDVVGLASNVKAISAGGNHTCALTTGGVVKCWGWNDGGELGDDTTTDRRVPTDVVGLPGGVIAIAAGGDHTCAVTAAGGVMCWGHNDNGQLGDGTTKNSWVPVNVVGLSSGVGTLTAGDHHTCALLSGGQALSSMGGLKCWGSNTTGQLGDGSTADKQTPVDVSGLTSGIATNATGWNHTCAVTTGGGLKCWGSDFKGELGNGNLGYGYWQYPVDVQGLASGIAAVAGGDSFTCALTTAGGVKCWGWNIDGQLGDNTTNDRHTPVDVIGLP